MKKFISIIIAAFIGVSFVHDAKSIEIGELPHNSTTITSNDIVPMENNATTKRATIAQILGLVSGDASISSAGILTNSKFESGSIVWSGLYSSLNAAISTIGSTPITLIISTPMNLTANATVPATLGIEVTANASITQTSSYTLIINGPFHADDQVFSGFSPGQVTFGAGFIDSVRPQWWGAKGDGTTNDTVAIQCAHSAFPIVFYPFSPGGRYNLTSITLPQGAQIIGEAKSVLGTTNALYTQVYGTTSAFVYQMDVPSGASWVGPQFRNIVISGQNGVRLNDPSKDATLNGVQGYIMDPSFRRVLVVQTSSRGGTGIQVTDAFHLEISDQCEIEGFSYNLDLYHCELSYIVHNRFWNFGKANIRLTPTGSSAGSGMTLIEHNDLLSGKTGATGFIVGGDFDLTIRNNYVEQTSAEGTGLTAAFVFDPTMQNFTLEDNYVAIPSVCAPNWLSVTTGPYASNLLGSVRITGNKLAQDPVTGSYPSALFNGGSGLLTYVSQGQGITICRHEGNTSEGGIPFNSVESADTILPCGTVSVMTPNMPGVVQSAGWGVKTYLLNNNQLMLPNNGGPVTFQAPLYPLTGTFAVYVLAYAARPESITASILDNGTVVDNTATLSLTTVPTWFQITASLAISTNLGVQFRNPSAGSNTAYIIAVVVNNARI
jgi:hypothetical protein